MGSVFFLKTMDGKLSSFLDDYGNVYESPYCNTANLPIQYEAGTQRWKIERGGGDFFLPSSAIEREREIAVQ